MSAAPRLLILETSGRVGHVALACGETLLRGQRLDEARRHARDLVPAVAQLLQEEGWRPRDLEGVIVSRGPGSYTGLRVGIMSAKTLAYATGCRLIGVDTFAAIAHQAPAEAERLFVIADAQQDKVYVQQFQRGVAAPLVICPLAEWFAGLNVSTWVTGPGLRQYGARIPATTPRVATELWEPLPECLLQLGLARYRDGQSHDLHALEPLYLRPSSAEEKWQDR
jgi:tRNA threonylcarbamoyladenosine biosynthesis protein TsaB